MLPNFVIIGAQKAGTSSLYRYLRDHPQVFMSKPKELYFFTEEHNWSRGTDWYEQQFGAAAGALAVGEGSVAYTMYPTYRGVPERMAKVLPDVRLIYLVRHPIERMRSDYLQYRYPKARRRIRWKPERLPVEEALLTNPRYLNYSRYGMQIEQYMEHFSAEQLLVIRSEDLREARIPTLRRVWEFLEVDPDWVPPALDREFNRTEGKQRPRGPVTRAIRRLPGYSAAGNHVPAALRSWHRRLTLLEVQPGNAVIPADVMARLEDALRDDVMDLERYAGAEFHGWGIASSEDRARPLWGTERDPKWIRED